MCLRLQQLNQPPGAGLIGGALTFGGGEYASLARAGFVECCGGSVTGYCFSNQRGHTTVHAHHAAAVVAATATAAEKQQHSYRCYQHEHQCL